MSDRRSRAASALLLAGALGLAACGQKGPLYLPDEARDIVTRPAPPGASPDTPQTVDSPQGPPSPAPEVTAPADDKDKRNPSPNPR